MSVCCLQEEAISDADLEALLDRTDMIREHQENQRVKQTRGRRLVFNNDDMIKKVFKN